VVDRRSSVQQVDPANRLVERTQPQRRENLAHLLGDVLEEGDDELGLTRESLA
jgi:hypothetical protein